MSDSLSKQVAQFMQQQPKRRSGRARAAVIALRDEIQKAMDDGWSVMAIWQTLQAKGSVAVGYHAFRRYVAQLVVAPMVRAEPAVALRRPLAAPVPGAANEEPRRFRHERVPRKEEIY